MQHALVNMKKQMVHNLYILKLKWKSNNPWNLHFVDPGLYDMLLWAYLDFMNYLFASLVLLGKDFTIYLRKNIK